MPRVFFFVIFIAAIIIVFGLVQILLLRTLHRDWWRRRWIRRSAWSLPLIGLAFFVVFALGEYYQISWLGTVGSIVSVAALVLEIGLMLTLPVSGAIHGLNQLLDFISKRHPSRLEATDQNRRLFLKGAAAAVPLVTIATGLSGVGRAFASTDVYLRPMAITNLPKGLEGLRILHLSDLHLRHYITLETVEQIVEDARPFKPDLVLMTGDVADDLTQLGDVTRIMTTLAPRLGVYASMGNHEYFRGPDQVRRIYEASPVRLLINEGVGMDVDGTPLYVGAIDDPRAMSGLSPDFFHRTLEAALQERADDATVVLMSHRPDAFPYAAERGVHLTLAGHTHGGQIGWFGRSFLEGALPEKYLWGEYTLGDARLYTSCGAGHWFPFRLGCPAEAPVIELARA